MEISGYELEQALKGAASVIAQALPCRHKWKDPENMGMYTGNNVYSDCTVQRCEYCNLIRRVKET